MACEEPQTQVKSRQVKDSYVANSKVSASAFGLMKMGVVDAKQYGDATKAKRWR
jgi:hypothetical protein